MKFNIYGYKLVATHTYYVTDAQLVDVMDYVSRKIFPLIHNIDGSMVLNFKLLKFQTFKSEKNLL